LELQAEPNDDASVTRRSAWLNWLWEPENQVIDPGSMTGLPRNHCSSRKGRHKYCRKN
jgi:hypothetical protein